MLKISTSSIIIRVSLMTKAALNICITVTALLRGNSANCKKGLVY